MTEHPILFLFIVVACAVGMLSGMPDGREYQDEEDELELEEENP